MLHTIQTGNLTLTVNSKGAELWGLKGREEYLWSGEEAVWPWHTPICCPWCGAVEEDWFEYEGKRYSTGRHGFVRDMEHTLAERGDGFLRFVLDWPGDGERWPWAFRFATRHELREDRVLTTCAVTNLGQRPMPAQLGFHPGLRCPITPGQTREDCFIRFQKPEAPGGGDVFALDARSFENDSICFENLKSQWVQVEERKTGRYLRVTTENWPFVLLWSKPGVPGFVCIEPWSGYPGPGHDLAARPGTKMLNPGESLTGVQEIAIGERPAPRSPRE